MLTEPVLVTRLVSEALTHLEIPYFIGGSLAMAIHGVPRTILNVDLVADIQMVQIQPFLQALGEAYFADEQIVPNTIQPGQGFSLIHKKTSFTVNIFPAQDRAFVRTQFERRTAYTLAKETNQTAYVASPEDSILAQLEWFRIGIETPERPWLDVLNVFKIQDDHIDRSYLASWAMELGVSDLLTRALEQVP